ncbi:MAG: FAD-linked oxidase C-terminal domain-containing protein [Methylococcaceae bacterium]|nr:FAD-linked oxidase C-terminal domain-containing protein [Methylococcaceae bacterium]
MAIASEFITRLRQILPAGSVHTDPADCWAYGYDNSKKHAPPEAVAFPSRHEQVVELVRLCNEYQLPLTPRGRGTGTTGAVVPLSGGLVMSLERMNHILELSPDNRFAVVEPGLTNQGLQDAIKPLGFFWPPDPTSAAFCSIGGNLAYNSAGPRAVKYGTPRDNVLGLRAVTGDGRELRTGIYTSKGVVGYDLTRLIVGSEGTLAIITEATLKLTPLAEAKRTLRAVYADVDCAARAIARIMAQPLTPCALEFIDANAIEMIRQYSDADLPQGAGALLMIEADGPEAGLETAAVGIEKAATVDGLLDFRIARTAAEVDELWRTRKALSPALRKIAPGKINEDVVVPVTELPNLIAGLNALSQRFGLPIVNFGHAGNGNIHVNLLLDPSHPDQVERAHDCLGEIFDLVLRLRGTLSGEHGVGLEKRDYVDRELDAVSLDLMRAIKRQFDPNGILNMGKMLP